MIAAACRNKWQEIQNLTFEQLTGIDGIGDVMARAYVDYFENPENVKKVEQLLEVLELDESFEEAGGRLQGKTFVITGSLNHFDNRDACKAEILRLGGKTAGSVSSRTSYLINNDINSNSSN